MEMALSLHGTLESCCHYSKQTVLDRAGRQSALVEGRFLSCLPITILKFRFMPSLYLTRWQDMTEVYIHGMEKVNREYCLLEAAVGDSAVALRSYLQALPIKTSGWPL